MTVATNWWTEFDKGRILNKDEIESILPHRGDMSFLHRVSLHDQHILGELLIQDDAFWVPGHFPPKEPQTGSFKIGPIFPGVLMVESAAQLGIVFWRQQQGIEETSKRTMLFKQIEKATFNREARPGDRIIIKGELDKTSLRLMRCHFEGVVIKEGEDPTSCFECNIAGLSV
jgi:3-hydroxymyristoyl/3-hydroxydecanoyl-(acyl carrier protein) dehydratase